MSEIHYSRGAVVFLTGLSGSGKSTSAEAFAARLESQGRSVSIVDGDVLRALDANSLGFDRASREANVPVTPSLQAGEKLPIAVQSEHRLAH